MLRKLRRLARLSAGEWLVLIQLVVTSLIATIVLRLISLPRLIDLIFRCARNHWLAPFPLLHDHFDTSRLANLTDIAAWVTRRNGRCLMRSLLLFWVLKARGEPAELLIGVAKEAEVLRS